MRPVALAVKIHQDRAARHCLSPNCACWVSARPAPSVSITRRGRADWIVRRGTGASSSTASIAAAAAVSTSVAIYAWPLQRLR